MKIFNSKLWEKLMVSFLTVLVIVFALTLLANAKAGTINSELRIETYKIVTDDNTDDNLPNVLFLALHLFIQNPSRDSHSSSESI